MLGLSVYLLIYVYIPILSSCFRIKSCPQNLVICFRKADDQLRSIDTPATDENTGIAGSSPVLIHAYLILQEYTPERHPTLFQLKWRLPPADKSARHNP